MSRTPCNKFEKGKEVFVDHTVPKRPCHITPASLCIIHDQLEVSTDQQLDQHFPLFNLPSMILCEVVNVELRAETDSDEVYAQIMLHPEADQSEPTSPDPEPHEPER